VEEWSVNLFAVPDQYTGGSKEKIECGKQKNQFL